jgi:phosphoglycolate phosphatase-like HAD superfamily hydrolase
MRLSREECLYVGDMPLDVETATKAGVGCLLVATGAYSYSELTREVDVPVVESFSRILEYVERRKST